MCSHDTLSQFFLLGFQIMLIQSYLCLAQMEYVFHQCRALAIGTIANATVHRPAQLAGNYRCTPTTSGAPAGVGQLAKGHYRTGLGWGLELAKGLVEGGQGGNISGSGGANIISCPLDPTWTYPSQRADADLNRCIGDKAAG